MGEHDFPGDARTREELEAAGWKFGDFADFLGLDEAEAVMVAYRADLGAAIRRRRQALRLSQAAFGKLVGLSQSKVARVEIGAGEVSIDMLLATFVKVGGRPVFASPPEPDAAPVKPKASKPRAKKAPVA